LCRKRPYRDFFLRGIERRGLSCCSTLDADITASHFPRRYLHCQSWLTTPTRIFLCLLSQITNDIF
jgi:hypothetical protein